METAYPYRGVNELRDIYELVGVPKTDPEYDYLLNLALKDPDLCVVAVRMKPECDPAFHAT